MYKLVCAGVIVAFVLVLNTGSAFAQDFTVPVTIDGTTYTLTVTLDDDVISVTADSSEVEIGDITEALDDEEVASEEDLNALLATAESIPYDDLFRYNEDYVGDVVRFVGKVLEFQREPCFLNCDEAGHILRIAVTEGDYGIWDDPVYVNYDGDDRFLEDDIVTLWGTVEGLETYNALLGNSVTIPRIEALEIVLGQQENPVVAQETDSTEVASDDEASTVMPGTPAANRAANLRGGPGTAYPVVGSARLNQPLTIIGQNSDGTWVQLEGNEWIAAFLVDNLPTEIPLAEDIPETSVAEEISVEDTQTEETTETPVESPAAEESVEQSASSSSVVGMNEELQGNGWRFKAIETHKRKSVYFYDDGDAAMGHWLVVVLDAVNEQSGTDHFFRNVRPYLTDEAGNIYHMDGGASGYARWQYGGLSSAFVDVDPGNLARVAMAFDVPDGVGKVMLSTDLPAWIDLGNFDQMEIEDKQ